MAAVDVFYKNKTKPMARSFGNFEQLEQNVRSRFSEIPAGPIEIKAQVSSGKIYNVDDDVDLELVISQLESLHVRSLVKQRTVAIVVKVGEENYQVGQIPRPNSRVVQDRLKEFKANVDLGDRTSLEARLGGMCDVVDLFQLAATAANIPGSQLQKLEDEAYNTTVLLVDLHHNTDIYYTKCISACKLVLDTAEIAGAYHLDGLDDTALEELATLGNVSSDMKSHCETMVKKVSDGLERVRKVEVLFMNEVNVQENREEVKKKKRKELQNDKSKQEEEIDVKCANLREAETGAQRRQMRSGEIRDALASASVGAGTLAGAVSASVVTTLEASTLAMAIPAIGVPVALIAATGGLLYACSNKTARMNAQEVADEAMLAERRREEADARKKLMDLTYELDQLKDMDIKHVLCCIKEVKGQLKLLCSTLTAWEIFWQKLATQFFDNQIATEKRFVKHAGEDAADKLSASDVFGKQCFATGLINYLARWVAFQEHCKISQATIQSNIGPLHQLMERNLTTEEAREELPQRTRAIRERLSMSIVPMQ